MNILYIGDVMGEMGISVVEQVLPALRREHQLDLVVAQAENVTAGRGIDTNDYQRLKTAGVDFFTGGNHIFDNKSIYPQLADPAQPIIRPANYPLGTPGLGYKYISLPVGQVLVVSLLGQIVGKGVGVPLSNPLKVIDQIIGSQTDIERVATVINFHGDFSSEKVIIGHYLDGRATLVVGDHWHIPTADARVLPGGTAHITDVGMCGALNSSLGVTYDSVVPRWRDTIQTRNVLESSGPRQFNAVLVAANVACLADSIKQIRLIV